MPTYEFRNNETGEIEEYLLSFSAIDKFKEENPHLERIWTDTPNVIYKGSGFYSTDYKQVPKSKKSEHTEKSTDQKKKSITESTKNEKNAKKTEAKSTKRETKSSNKN
jgi:predicted nucleic acid-binding Zn ribbon protein|tara:strand:+ start:13827 stop:14150 length:324 start_codon:yes stop_codon:yes gene_type:complete